MELIILYIKGSLKDYLILLPFFILLELIFYAYCRKKKITVRIGFLIGFQALALLMTAIFGITDSLEIDELLKFGTSQISADQINPIPLLRSISDPTGLILNILLFLPLGLLLPLLLKSEKTFRDTIFAGFILSLLIEISQLFNGRIGYRRSADEYFGGSNRIRNISYHPAPLYMVSTGSPCRCRSIEAKIFSGSGLILWL